MRNQIQNMPRHSPGRQRGAAMLIAFLILLGVILAFMPMAAKWAERDAVDKQTQAVGKQMAQMAVGMQGFVAAAQESVNSGTNAAGYLDGATFNSIDFLKSPTCPGVGPDAAGNPTEGYVPCSFGNYGPNDTLFGGTFQTTFSHDGTTNYIEARTTFIPEYPGRPGYVGTIADKIANAAEATPAGSPSGTFVTIMANRPLTATTPDPKINNPADPDFGRVLMITSNAPSNDIYLRTDGTNQMLAALNMGGNDIENARDLTMSGDAEIGGDTEIAGDTIIGQDLQVAQSGYFANDVFAGNNVTADKTIRANEDVIAERNLIGEDTIALGATLSGGGNPRLTQAVFEKRMVNGPYPMTIPQPTCSIPGSNPQIFTSIQSISSPNGEPISGQLVAVSAAGGNWLIQPRVNSSQAQAWIDTPYAQVIVSAKCS